MELEVGFSLKGKENSNQGEPFRALSYWKLKTASHSAFSSEFPIKMHFSEEFPKTAAAFTLFYPHQALIKLMDELKWYIEVLSMILISALRLIHCCKGLVWTLEPLRTWWWREPDWQHLFDSLGAVAPKIPNAVTL